MGSFPFSQNTLFSFLPFLKKYITSGSVLHVSIPQSSPGRYAVFFPIYLSAERSIHYDTPNHSPEEFGSDMYQTGNKEKGFLDFLFLSSSFLFLPFFITFFVVSFLWRTLPVSANRQRGLWRLVQRTASTRTLKLHILFLDMFMPFDKMTPLTGYTFVWTLSTNASAYNKKSFVTFPLPLQSEIRLAHTGGACATPGTHSKRSL